MRKLLVVLLVFMFFSSCDTGEPSPKKPETIIINVPEDLLGASGSTGDEEPWAWDVIHELGIKWVTRLFRWNEFQTNPGYPGDTPEEELVSGWHWGLDDYVRKVNQEGMKVIGTIGCSDMEAYPPGTTDPGHYVPEEHIPSFVKYVKKIVEYYSYNEDPELHVDAWEIWNEGNWADWWRGTPLEFYKLHKAVAEAVREVNPDVPLFGFVASFLNYGDWTKNLIDGGYAPRDKLSGAAFHPYASNPNGTIGHLDKFSSIVAAGGFNEIWVTEVGFPYNGIGPNVINRRNNGSFMASTIALLASRNVSKIFWYQFSRNGLTGSNGGLGVNPDTYTSADPENFFQMTWWWRDSLISPWKVKYEDSALAFKLCSQRIPGATYHSDLPKRKGKIPASIQALYFEGTGGACTLVLWNDKPSPRTIKVTLPGADRILYDMDYDAWDRTGEKKYKPEMSSENIDETTTVELKANVVKFYTWNNTGGKVPEISVP